MDFGDYGAFYLKPEDVAEVAQAISGIGESDFRARFDQHSPIENEISPVTEGEDAGGISELPIQPLHSAGDVFLPGSRSLSRDVIPHRVAVVSLPEVVGFCLK